MARRGIPSFTTIAWGVAFGLLAVALATRVGFVNDAVGGGEFPL